MCAELMLDVENEGTVLNRYGKEPLNEFRKILTEVYRPHHERLSYYESDSRDKQFLAAPSFAQEYNDQIAKRKQETEETLELLYDEIEIYKNSIPVPDSEEWEIIAGIISEQTFAKECATHRNTILKSLRITTSHIRDLFARSVIFSEIRVVREATFDSRNKEIFIKGIHNVVTEQFAKFEEFKKTLKPLQMYLMRLRQAFELMTTAKAMIDKEFVDIQKDQDMSEEDIDDDESDDGEDEDDKERVVTYGAYIALVQAVNGIANDAYDRVRVVSEC